MWNLLKCPSCGNHYKKIGRSQRGTCSDKCTLEGRSVKNGDCIEYIGPYNKGGYGRIHTENGRKLAHRFAYELYIGKFDPNLSVCHKCDNPKCVNPEHLFLGSQVDNNADKLSKNRQAKGTDFPHAKANPEVVAYIRSSSKTLRALESELGLDFSLIGKIKRKAIWRYA